MKVKKAIIPAAGLGTRLLPATKAMPKEMLPIIDKPTIQYIVEEAVSAGITDILIVTGKGKKAIEDHFDTSLLLEETLKSKGNIHILEEMEQISSMADIYYIRQGVPKGLGHAIWSARKFIGDEPFAVLLGDTIIQDNGQFLLEMINLYEVYQSSIIGVTPVPDSVVDRYGIIDASGGEDSIYKINRLVEKPEIGSAPSNLAIVGRYILTPTIFNLLENQEPGVGNEIQLTDALQTLLKYEAIHAKVLKGKSYDIGEKVGYLKTIIEFALEREDISAEILAFLEDIVSKRQTS